MISEMSWVVLLDCKTQSSFQPNIFSLRFSGFLFELKMQYDTFCSFVSLVWFFSVWLSGCVSDELSGVASKVMITSSSASSSSYRSSSLPPYPVSFYWSEDKYPNPRDDPFGCRQPRSSLLCDPDQILDANQGLCERIWQSIQFHLFFSATNSWPSRTKSTFDKMFLREMPIGWSWNQSSSRPSTKHWRHSIWVSVCQLDWASMQIRFVFGKWWCSVISF